MAPSSEWRCVALFFNNTTAPIHLAAAATTAYTDGMSADGLLQATMGGEEPLQGIPVPAAVNSLAWSSREDRLFTADTVGFVKASVIRTLKIVTAFHVPESACSEAADRETRHISIQLREVENRLPLFRQPLSVIFRKYQQNSSG